MPQYGFFPATFPFLPIAPTLPARARGSIEAVEGIDQADLHDQRRQGSLSVMPCGFVPNLVGHWIYAVAQPCCGLRERGAFRLGEVRRIAPSGQGEETLVGLSSLLQFTRMHVGTNAAAIDLANAQLDELAETLLRGNGRQNRRNEPQFEYDWRLLSTRLSPTRWPCESLMIQVQQASWGGRSWLLGLEARELISEISLLFIVDLERLRLPTVLA